MQACCSNLCIKAVRVTDAKLLAFDLLGFASPCLRWFCMHVQAFAYIVNDNIHGAQWLILVLTCLLHRIYGMMSGLTSGNGASRSQKQRSSPAVDPEILGADPKNDPWN